MTAVEDQTKNDKYPWAFYEVMRYTVFLVTMECEKENFCYKHITAKLNS